MKGLNEYFSNIRKPRNEYFNFLVKFETLKLFRIHNWFNQI